MTTGQCREVQQKCSYSKTLRGPTEVSGYHLVKRMQLEIFKQGTNSRIRFVILKLQSFILLDLRFLPVLSSYRVSSREHKGEDKSIPTGFDSRRSVFLSKLKL